MIRNERHTTDLGYPIMTPHVDISMISLRRVIRIRGALKLEAPRYCSAQRVDVGTVMKGRYAITLLHGSLF